MLIETYKGVSVFHDAAKDEFYTQIVINKRSGKSDEFIKGGRLGAIRDNIDKFLNTAAKKPIITKAWHKGRYETDKYEKVDIIIMNAISNTVMIKFEDGKTKSLSFLGYNREGGLFLSCKENDEIIKNLNKKEQEIAKIKKETSCTSGKLIPLKSEHFA